MIFHSRVYFYRIMIDTHTHLYLPEFEEDGEVSAVKRALDAGVEHLVFPNVDLNTVEPMTRLAAAFPNQISCAMGLHPTEIDDNWKENLNRIFEIIGSGNRYVAIGEVGIDLYWDKTYRDAQMLAFSLQAAKAVELGLPLIIHCRDGLDEVLEVLKDYPGVQAVFHSFGGTEADVDRIRALGDFYFGINGIVTFKNSKLRDVLPAIGIDRILLETDSPYLAPVPHRGKRNESAFIPHIAAHIAQSMEIPFATVDSTTTLNARNLFKI